MGTIGVVLALAVAPLQWDAAVEGPSDPGPPLWGDDVHVWDMGADSSTYICPGFEYCDLVAYSDTLYAMAIKDKPLLDAFNIYWSIDSETWNKRKTISSYSETYAPDMVLNSDGSYLCISSSSRTPDSTYYLIMRYDMPGFDNFRFNYVSLPAGSDTVCTAKLVENRSTGDFWMFGTDTSGEMYLALSDDTCKTWGEWSPVLSNASRQSVDSDNAGNIYVTYRDLSTGEAKLAVFTDPESWTTHTIGTIAADGCPKVSVFRNVVTTIAVTYHNDSDQVVIASSTDAGTNWDIEIYGAGRFPNIDIDRVTGECGLCFVGPLGISIDVATASSFSGIASAPSATASDNLPFVNGPAIIKHEFVQGEYGLLYLAATDAGFPKDLWFDSSLFTGVEGGEAAQTSPVSVYPNPAAGSFTASFRLPEPQQASLSVYSADGRRVGSFFSGVTDGEDVTVDAELPAGVYSVVLRSGSGVSSARMVSL